MIFERAQWPCGLSFAGVTADLSTSLRFGRDAKLGVTANQAFLNPIFILGLALPTVIVSYPCNARMGHPKSA
jgi:hypothetical protein